MEGYNIHRCDQSDLQRLYNERKYCQPAKEIAIIFKQHYDNNHHLRNVHCAATTQHHACLGQEGNLTAMQ